MNRCRGTEAGHLKVYGQGQKIWAVIGEDHESLDCDADGDFAARFTAQLKGFQLWHGSCQVHDDIVVHP